MKVSSERPQARGRSSARHDPGGRFDLLKTTLGAVHRGKRLDTMIAYLAERYDSLAEVLSAPADQLREDPNVGPAATKAIASLNLTMIEAAFAPLQTRSVLDDTRSVIVYLQLLFGRRREEEARVLYLDAKYAVFSQELIAAGTGGAVEVRPFLVARLAVKAGATAIIVVHNHPSGDPRPSQMDVETTAEIERCCTAVGIRFIDHIIVSFGKWFSFRSGGKMMEPPPDVMEPKM